MPSDYERIPTALRQKIAQRAKHEHFDWSEDLTQLLGQTPCGRATIAALSLNRPGVVNLRRLLVLAGLHPPNQ